jgi:hypothetical protein
MMNAAGGGGAALAIAASALALAFVAHARAPLLLRLCGRGGHDGEMAWLAQRPALLFSAVGFLRVNAFADARSRFFFAEGGEALFADAEGGGERRAPSLFSRRPRARSMRSQHSLPPRPLSQHARSPQTTTTATAAVINNNNNNNNKKPRAATQAPRSKKKMATKTDRRVSMENAKQQTSKTSTVAIMHIDKALAARNSRLLLLRKCAIDARGRHPEVKDAKRIVDLAKKDPRFLAFEQTQSEEVIALLLQAADAQEEYQATNEAAGEEGGAGGEEGGEQTAQAAAAAGGGGKRGREKAAAATATEEDEDDDAMDVDGDDAATKKPVAARKKAAAGGGAAAERPSAPTPPPVLPASATATSAPFFSAAAGEARRAAVERYPTRAIANDIDLVLAQTACGDDDLQREIDALLAEESERWAKEAHDKLLAGRGAKNISATAAVSTCWQANGAANKSREIVLLARLDAALRQYSTDREVKWSVEPR